MGNTEFDGELISVEQATPTINLQRNEQNTTDDDFFPMDGEVIEYVAKTAGQDVSNHFDEDNFYPANGIFKGTIFDKTERQKRRAVRQQRKSAKVAAKNEETLSRAELNKTVGKDKPSDLALADALKADAQKADTTTTEKEPMSLNTKIAIGVGVTVFLGVVGFVLYKRFKK
jgi:hypothetical protein